MGPPRSVTVIGGGLSGLSTAFHLARRFPAHSGTRITLLEQSNRLGGWVKSERVRVKDRHGHQADILLESGPRTLRPASKAILELVRVPIHLMVRSSLSKMCDVSFEGDGTVHVKRCISRVPKPGEVLSLFADAVHFAAFASVLAKRADDGTGSALREDIFGSV